MHKNRILISSIRILAIFLAWKTCIPLTCAQNLVPNPSFEIYTVCPQYVGQGGPLEATPWTSPVETADYFNACSPLPCCGVPYNSLGYQHAYTGGAITGLYTKKASVFYREFLQVLLLDTLEEGECYYVSFRINLSNEACATDKIGALLTPDAATEFAGAVPQIDWGGQFFDDTLQWTHIFGYFIAEGDELYLTIGNFYSDAETEMYPLCNDFFAKGYYYIDEV